MTGGKDTGLVDNGMEEKEDDVHGRGGRGVGSYESEFTRIRSYKHLSPQIDRERFNGVLYKL